MSGESELPMPSLDIPASHAHLLDQPMTAVLTTLNPDGQPQSTAIWFIVDGGELRASFATNRRKYKNLTRDPRATLFIFDSANPFRTLEIRSTVELRPDPDNVLVAKIAERYQTPLDAFGDASDEHVAATFRPSRIVALG
jgi:PPOX class probable F420-dependent enzyme